METRLSRREFAYIAGGAGALIPAAATEARGAQAGGATAEELYPYYTGRSAVSIVKGENRRKNIHDALLAIDDQILPVLKRKKHVLLKPNCVTESANACVDPDAVRGALDYLAPRFKGPIYVGESSASGRSMEIFELMKYPALESEFKSQKVKLVDLNAEPQLEVINILDENLHLRPIRLNKRFLDPDAYLISMPMAKTHLICIVTLATKNIVLAAPTRVQPKTKVTSGPAFARPENDKWKIHSSYRVCNYNMMSVAQKLRPFWGATVIDAYRGMEKNGPVSGIDIEHKIAVASTDFIAADRVMTEAMGIDPAWVGHLVYSWQAGLGQFDPAKIDIRGEKIASVRLKYQLPTEIDKLQEWMRPMDDVPAKVPAL